MSNTHNVQFKEEEELLQRHVGEAKNIASK